ncbi:MAG: L-serine ammonia-lyase [Planctomycetaceae bacterium]|nr:L-serine ammonia-lyase [Planctomycetaceae bacterium]
MTISVFDLYTIGIGPSSSHSVGPMRAAHHFVHSLRSSDAEEGEGARRQAIWSNLQRIEVNLYGSLALTGVGHGTDKAILMGLMGFQPETIEPDHVDSLFTAIRESGQLGLLNEKRIRFTYDEDFRFLRKVTLPEHPNGMQLTACDGDGAVLAQETYFSIGGGFILTRAEALAGGCGRDATGLPFPFERGADLLRLSREHQLPFSQLVLENEKKWLPENEIRARLLRIWDVMQGCVQRGCEREGILPGGLKVRRRAASVFRSLTAAEQRDAADPLNVMDWVNLYALAVNEENAAGGRVVTAPTNGAAGILPAVLHYYRRFVPGSHDDGVIRFLLTAAAIGMLYKKNASISGAEVGCQGEVGVACSMAAGGLTEVLGGTPEQVEQAAEIGMEHNLGLTCDPIGGLVQVPCIERNAMGAVKAINAARMALRGDGTHHVSLDKVIATMRRTGLDMNRKYKETSQGGLAVNLPEC